MLKKILVTIIISILLWSCSAIKNKNPKNNFSELLQNYQVESTKLYPKIQNRLSSKYWHRAGIFFNNFKKRVLSINREKLSEDDQMSYDILL
nr:hypothetical protein [uncultured Flavobacterium sp.]